MTPISRYFSILLALAITVPLPLFGSQPTRDADLLKVRNSVWHAWFADDAQLLRRRVPPETIVISAGDKQWKGQSDVLREAADFRASGAKLTRLDFPQTLIQHFGSVAIVWSDYVIETQSGGKPSITSGRATEIFVWRDGRWVNPGWHTDAEKLQTPCSDSACSTMA